MTCSKLLLLNKTLIRFVDNHFGLTYIHGYLAHNIIVDKELNLLILQALRTTLVKTSTYRS